MIADLLLGGEEFIDIVEDQDARSMPEEFFQQIFEMFLYLNHFVVAVAREVSV